MKLKKIRKIGLVLFVGVGLVGLLMGGLLTRDVSDTKLASATVMITNMAKNSGGSGAVLFSTPTFSRVLTNSHVCGVVANGGYVITEDNSSHLVTAYKQSKIHDLCLIEVAADLHANSKLASRAPARYEAARVIGHPGLYPTVITHGHFSGKRVISVAIGHRECTKEEMDNPDTGLFCALIGQLPIIKKFETVLVTATIMPGSSGSAIYNDNGEVSAVVFAGSGDIGYAFSVPFEYIAYFLLVEQNYLEGQFPKSDARSPNSLEKDFELACEHATTERQKYICEVVSNSYL